VCKALDSVGEDEGCSSGGDYAGLNVFFAFVVDPFCVYQLADMIANSGREMEVDWVINGTVNGLEETEMGYSSEAYRDRTHEYAQGGILGM
jgi:hypothetical protein